MIWTIFKKEEKRDSFKQGIYVKNSKPRERRGAALAAWRRPLPTAAGGGGAGAPERPYELVVFGASGFTGQFVVEEVARAAGGGELRGALRWAVAGRRREKLQAVLERAAERLGKAALGAEVGVLLCDVGDAASLAAAARQTRLVLNCVGPSRFFGEPVVEACVENGASCIDVSGEPRFLEGMYLQYDGTAAEKGVYVIGSCGFDSIPADLGVLYTRDKLKGFLCTRWDLEVSCLRPCGSRQPEEASKKDRLCPCSSSWCKT
ncbi:saccharopine dehydrogenase-like oxidoreductase [Sarcoramphus papa]